MQLYGKRVEESTEGPITHPHTNKKKKIIMIEITTSPSTEGGGHTNKHTLFFLDLFGCHSDLNML